MRHVAPIVVPSGGDYELVGAWRDVPDGFRTDGASIPRLLWPLIGSPFEPCLLPAAISHDYAYRVGFDREGADRELFEVLLDTGVHPARAWLIFLGVRVFGWLYWRRCRYGRGLS